MPSSGYAGQNRNKPVASGSTPSHPHQPTLSQQLGILRREGVVSTRRDGKFIWYQLNDPRILQLIQTMYRLYCPA